MKKNTDVLEVEAEEVSENPLERTIEKELIKNNVTDAVISAMVEKYGSMALRSIDDKEMYLDIKGARKEVRAVGIIAEKICKAGREDAVKIQKMWLKKENEVLGKIAVVQDKLDAEIKKFDDEVARIEAEEAKRKEEAFIKRQSELLKYGARYDNGSYILNHISYESINIQEADEEIYNDVILPKYRKQFEANEAEWVAEEKKREDAANKLKEEQAALQKQQEEFKQQQEAFRLQQEQAQRQMAETERLQREESNRIELEEKKRISAIQNSRLQMLLPYNPSGSDVDMATLWTLSDIQFNEILEIKKAQFTTNQETEKIRLQEEAATKERLRIEEENRQKEVLRQQQEQKQQEEAAKASDRDKWIALVANINAISIPEFKSGVYKGKLSILKEKLEEINQL